jgi:hypothetical protein
VPKKLTYDFVKKSFEKEGYTLLSKEYINSRTKLSYICPKGHKHFITWDNWRGHHRCPSCVGLAKPTICKVKTYFEAEGYVLLDKVYVNAHTKLNYVCVEGHKHSITWNNWRRGKRCPYCAGQCRPNIKEIRSSFEKEGYILLNTIYRNNNTKLRYICPKGHEHCITWGSWQSGTRCAYCMGKILNIKDIKNSFVSEGYTLLSKYINSNTYLNYKCPVGHHHSMVWDNWKQGKRCPTCAALARFGSMHWNWMGGKSFEPYCQEWKDKEYKQAIRDRDGNKCLNPYCDSPNKNDLTIHHIDYDKKNCNPGNLITVCRSCNSKANKDREWHRAWYSALMYRKYFNNKRIKI